MSNIVFFNDEVKKEYQSMVGNHHGLASIIKSLITDSGSIKIMSIDDALCGKRMYININNKLIRLDFDFLKKKIYLKKDDEPYSEIYNLHVRKQLKPSGFLYEDEARNVIKKDFYFGDNEQIYCYDIEDIGKHYMLIIKNRDKSFNEENFIINLLHSQVKFNSIRNLFITLTELVNVNETDIKLGDAKGSNISTENGKILTYVEYIEKEDQYEKIYMDNDQFFIERKVKEEYQDEITGYVKKLGEYHGKEKR